MDELSASGGDSQARNPVCAGISRSTIPLPQDRPEKEPTPATSEDEEQPDQDFISSLPDDILHIILSKLQIRDAAVTTAVSKRWAPLFPTLPSLIISAASFNPRNPNYHPRTWEFFPSVQNRTAWINALFSVLNSRIDPIKKFHIAVGILDLYKYDFDKVFCDVCAAGVEELSIMNTASCCYKIPPPIFACNTITKMEICQCRLVVPSILTGLMSVKSLSLSAIEVADDDLQRMISQCKAMEKLFISDCLNVKNIVISAEILTMLLINLHHPVGIVLKNVPRLAYVSVFFGYSYEDDLEEIRFDDEEGDGDLTFEGINEAAKLTSFLNGLRNVKNLFLNFSDKYGMILSNQGMTLPTRLSPKCFLIELKKLCICLPTNDHIFNMIISCLLCSSPHLMDIILCVDRYQQDEYIEDECIQTIGSSLDFWEKRLPMECVKDHLTTATFYFDECISEDCLVFLKFLLLNAENLKSMNMLFYNRERETI